jgi:hypothetical protein
MYELYAVIFTSSIQGTSLLNGSYFRLLFCFCFFLLYFLISLPTFRRGYKITGINFSVT